MAERSERTTRTSRASQELHQQLRDAREQSAASREILAALGRAGANPGDILDTILEHAARLCRAQAATRRALPAFPLAVRLRIRSGRLIVAARPGHLISRL